MIELKTSYENLLKEKGQKNIEMEDKIKKLNKDLKKLHVEIEIRDKFERGEYGLTTLEEKDK